MTPSGATALFHILGFLTESALYVMLAAMTLGARSNAVTAQVRPARSDLIPLATAALGLVWNFGEVVTYGMYQTESGAPAWLTVGAFAALFYLPAVVVHSALAGTSSTRSSARRPDARQALVLLAYGLSTTATIQNIVAALRGAAIPSPSSFPVLSIGFLTVVGLLWFYSRRQPTWRRALPVGAVAAFAVMVAHLTQHSNAADRWPIELIGHHGSLLVVLVILYQDYRFAFADFFLKRAVVLLVLTALAATLYAGIVAPFLLPRLSTSGGGLATNPLAATALLTLWVGTALLYPRLRRVIIRFVDRTVLRRPETGRLLADLATTTAALTTVDAVLDATCEGVARGLSATRYSWSAEPESNGVGPGGGFPDATVSIAAGAREATVRVVTTDAPAYRVAIGGLSAGRRLLSDDYALLDGAAHLAARRIDTLRVAHERCERDVREQQIMRLATEAELRALRAQLNPHFLFNALTTIGYLVREAPDRALETLLRLTDVLRAVLRRTDGDFTTLGEELDIVSSYLAIERTRFEDRLRVTTDVAPELNALRVPPLVLQPVVENAVKHGIGSLIRGGSIHITARVETQVTRPQVESAPIGTAAQQHLWLTVTDTGMGTAPSEMARRRRTGTGLANLERRLERYFGRAASLDIRSAVGVGTTVDIRFPANIADAGHAPV